MPPENDNFTKCFRHMYEYRMNSVKMELKLRQGADEYLNFTC